MKTKLLNFLFYTALFLVLAASVTASSHRNSAPPLPPPLPPPLAAPSPEKDLDLSGPVEAAPVEDVFQISYIENPHLDLLGANEDYMGWIRVPGTQVNAPFVKGSDNSEYLRQGFHGGYALEGTVFMDYRNAGFGFSRHVVLYGHNMKDNSMFGDLDKYKDPAFALEHGTIEIEDLYGSRTFRIYSSYFAEAEPSLIGLSLDQDSWIGYVEGQIGRSTVDYGLVPGGEAQLLTLVTCSYEQDDGRFFVHAVMEQSSDQ